MHLHKDEEATDASGEPPETVGDQTLAVGTTGESSPGLRHPSSPFGEVGVTNWACHAVAGLGLAKASHLYIGVTVEYDQRSNTFLSVHVHATSG